MIPGRTRLGSRLVLTGAARNNTRTHACFTLARTTYRAMATAAADTNRSSADSATYSDEALHVPTQNNEGYLANLSFAVKDCFDVKGAPTGFGNPTWLATHAECAQTHAVAVRTLRKSSPGQQKANKQQPVVQGDLRVEKPDHLCPD